jgi:hypothetical protein
MQIKISGVGATLPLSGAVTRHEKNTPGLGAPISRGDSGFCVSGFSVRSRWLAPLGTRPVTFCQFVSPWIPRIIMVCIEIQQNGFVSSEKKYRRIIPVAILRGGRVRGHWGRKSLPIGRAMYPSERHNHNPDSIIH